MAPSSPWFIGAPQGPLRFTPLRFCPPNTGVYHDTTQSLTDGPDSLLSRLEAVDKFALYGRQHAHVDHLSGIEKATIEDGQLAVKLDDVMYLIDGLLKPVRTRLAQTRSVLELVQLVLDPQVLQAVELSSQRLNVRNKLKLLLVRLKDTGDEMSRLSLSVLVYFLSKSDDTKDYFDAQVIAAIVHALKQENEQKEVKNTAVSDTKSTKKCLKRKQAETLETSTTLVLDEFCLMQLDEDHAVFRW
ncbi:hypothetical protein PPTG_13639 [Phytophthora nicotianae INRA-310]|uniref:Uncharacterized protein n=1 Tax=Phytophthora nicotianae (strain INRA-310) TaxID=761204 RepID=W2PZC7_PHYN3|nr:hypothetical protein PPTG_13639 [Phytophthora nicotianae INRA-310]ETN06278.1 hypothetical protein PPTG_13639 [Phytophthora nicotianae INRA-310]